MVSPDRSFAASLEMFLSRGVADLSETLQIFPAMQNL
jgi:hypothetical protein